MLEYIFTFVKSAVGHTTYVFRDPVTRLMIEKENFQNDFNEFWIVLIGLIGGIGLLYSGAFYKCDYNQSVVP